MERVTGGARPFVDNMIVPVERGTGAIAMRRRRAHPRHSIDATDGLGDPAAMFDYWHE
ncbi:hypothetical protein NDR89_10340 [Cupriavidus gilardii]|uniref:Uncharacterized protein n=1 Tax=Cupriavidus gilardii TaxID=82541 RepID=A0ABY4VXT3_9BURK|nr:hypothetical protein [Cupriavidus gilardii]USE80198.1 hypothetical protein NDR89_10340 [Cupriavidus gilardii]